MKHRLLKGIFLISFSVIILIAGILNVSAESVPYKVMYTSEDGGYTATKISHPDKDVKTSDGIVDYTGNGTLGVNLENGEGDRSQNYSWGSIGYGDYMYIGTCYDSWLSTFELMKSCLGRDYDEEVLMNALDTMFHGDFCTGEEDGGDAKGVLLKINVKNGEVKLLMSMDTTGTNCIFRNAVEFNGKLYFCGSVNSIPCIYQVDPETDECKQVYAGMTLEEYYSAYQRGICVGIRGMCVYDNKLIISCITAEGAVICESETPEDQNSFRVIAKNEDLFNYPAYHYCDSIYGGSIFDMKQFGDKLYIAICTGTPENRTDENNMQSFAVVRGESNNNGKWEWTSVIGDTENDNAKYTFGIDPERTRSGAATLMPFGDYLYIGEYNDEEIAVERMLFDNDFDFMNANFKQSVNLYRMDKNENIELVVGDADEMFPEGSLSGIGSGFGRNENQYIWKMEVYDGKLYVGTFDTSSFLAPLNEFVNDETATDEWKESVAYYASQLCQDYNGFPDGALECTEYLKEAEPGFDFYVTEDGVNFETITENGFGDPYNHGLRAFGITNDGLYIGTANPFYGTQVWKLSETQTEPSDENNPSNSTEPSTQVSTNTSSSDMKNTTEGNTVVNQNSGALQTGGTFNIILWIILLISFSVVLISCRKLTYKEELTDYKR